jgi:hypothetical protein
LGQDRPATVNGCVAPGSGGREQSGHLGAARAAGGLRLDQSRGGPDRRRGRRFAVPGRQHDEAVVLIAVYRQLDLNQLHVDQKVEVTPWFRSAVGGEPFPLPADEIDTDLAALRGRHVPLVDLIERMITISSNDATNLLMELVGLSPLGVVLSDLGATGSCILRLTSDRSAQALGCANRSTPSTSAGCSLGPPPGGRLRPLDAGRCEGYCGCSSNVTRSLSLSLHCNHCRPIEERNRRIGGPGRTRDRRPHWSGRRGAEARSWLRWRRRTGYHIRRARQAS